uniref:hypothetical protein n=1 Tax=Aeromonas sobria TaxID=646 RepID=UPI001CA31F5A
NFRQLVLPFAERMNSNQVNSLLDAVLSNGQNWDASETPSLLLIALQNIAPENRPARESMTRFYVRCTELRQTRSYTRIFDLFTSYGWVRPETEAN